MHFTIFHPQTAKERYLGSVGVVVRADVKGDKRSLCVEHARRDGRAELVCGGGGAGG